MKKYRAGWDISFIRYMNDIYISECLNLSYTCQFYKDLYNKYTPIVDSHYVETKHKKQICIDNIPKLCKNVCIFYY